MSLQPPELRGHGLQGVAHLLAKTEDKVTKGVLSSLFRCVNRSSLGYRRATYLHWFTEEHDQQWDHLIILLKNEGEG